MTGCYAIYPFSTGSDQILVQVWSNANGWELSCFIQKCLTMIRKDISFVIINCSCFIVKEKWLTYEMPCSAETSRCSYYFFSLCNIYAIDITIAHVLDGFGHSTNIFKRNMNEYRHIEFTFAHVIILPMTVHIILLNDVNPTADGIIVKRRCRKYNCNCETMDASALIMIGIILNYSCFPSWFVFTNINDASCFDLNFSQDLHQQWIFRQLCSIENN